LIETEDIVKTPASAGRSLSFLAKQDFDRASVEILRLAVQDDTLARGSLVMPSEARDLGVRAGEDPGDGGEFGYNAGWDG